jgi:hypothetical protein
MSGDLEILGSASGSSADSEGLTAEVNEANRDASGSLLSVTWSIENSGSSAEPLVWLRDRSYSYSGPNYAGVTARSNETGTRFHPIMDGSGNCLCSGPTSNDLSQQVSPDEKISYWSLFSVPADVETVTIEIPNFDPIEDIPIS